MYDELIRGEFPVTVTLECKRKIDGDHFHNHTQLWYVLSGSLKQTVGKKTHLQTPGTMTVIPPYTRHHIDTSTSDDTPIFVSVSFTDNFLTSYGYNYFSFADNFPRFEGHELPDFSELTGAKRDIADTLVRKMHAEFSKHFKMNYDVLRELLVELLKIFCKNEKKDDDITLSKERFEAISKAVVFISANYNKKITIDDACHVSTMSRRVFTNSFKIITGLTFSDFLTRVRLEKARYYVLFSNKSSSEIASICGFCDKAHLSRTFKKYYHMTPTDYHTTRLPHALAIHKEYESRWGWLKSEKKESE